MSNIVPVRIASDAVTLKDGHPITTSLSVAAVFGRRHDRVLRAAQELDCSDEFRRTNFGEAEYIDAQGKPRPMVEMTRDGFTFLVMGFTGKAAAAFKEGYIAAFNALEAKACGTASIPDCASPLSLAQYRAARAQLQALGHSLDQATVTLTAGQVDDLLEDSPRAPTTRRFTAEERSEVERRLAAGDGVSRIASDMGCNKTSIYRIAHQIGEALDQAAGGAA